MIFQIRGSSSYMNGDKSLVWWPRFHMSCALVRWVLVFWIHASKWAGKTLMPPWTARLRTSQTEDRVRKRIQGVRACMTRSWRNVTKNGHNYDKLTSRDHIYDPSTLTPPQNEVYSKDFTITPWWWPLLNRPLYFFSFF